MNIYYFAAMYNSLQYKTKQFLFFLVKIAIVFGAFYFIYNKTVHNEHISFQQFITQLENSIFKNYTTLIFLLCFTLANWFFEILKWKALVSFLRKISFVAAAKQSLGSLTASLFTPNRIGEYGAKAIYFQKGTRKKAMLLNLLGNMMQMATTVVFGTLGLIYFTTHFEVAIDGYRFKKAAYFLAVLFVFVMTGSIKGYQKIRGFYIDKILMFVRSLPLQIHFQNAFYSIVRYLIFSHQFYFLLRLFGVEGDYITLLSLISSMYFIASIVPGLALLDWLIKGSVAIWIFGFIHVNELIIVTITLLMWLLNFGLPALIGSYFVLNFNYYKRQ
jgi:hypothetical protein